MKKPRFLSLAFLTVIAVAAQTPTPVPVREEPRHKVMFENDFIRMIDVHVAPGETTLVHVHVIPSVVVNLSNTMILSQELGRPPAQPRRVAVGDTRYAPYDEVSLTHSVMNQSADVFHVLDIELLRPKSTEAWGPVAAQPKLKLAREQKLVRVYKLHADAGSPVEIPASPRAWLLIDVSGTVRAFPAIGKTGTVCQLETGEYGFTPPGAGFQVRAMKATGAECILLELR